MTHARKMSSSRTDFNRLGSVGLAVVMAWLLVGCGGVPEASVSTHPAAVNVVPRSTAPTTPSAAPNTPSAAPIFEGTQKILVKDGVPQAGYSATVSFSLAEIATTSKPGTKLGESSLIPSASGATMTIKNTTPQRNFAWGVSSFSLFAYYAPDLGICDYLATNAIKKSSNGCAVFLANGVPGSPVSTGYALAPDETFDAPIKLASGDQLVSVPDQDVDRLKRALAAPTDLMLVFSEGDFDNVDIDGTCTFSAGTAMVNVQMQSWLVLQSKSQLPPDYCS